MRLQDYDQLLVAIISWTCYYVQMEDTIKISSNLVALSLNPDFVIEQNIARPRNDSESAKFAQSHQIALLGLQLALNDGNVFVSITGAKFVGKSLLLKSFLEIAQSKSRLCVTIPAPDQFDIQRIENVEQSIQSIIINSSSRIDSVLFTVDNAHTCSEALLHFLNSIAKDRYRSPCTQVVLVGESALWSRLDLLSYTDLRKRLAIRYGLNAQTNETGAKI